MKSLRVFLRRLIGTIRPDHTSYDIDSEVRSHIDQQTEDLMNSGWSREAARAEALRRFGQVERTKDQYRDRARLPRLDGVVRDVRFSLRMLFRRPGFSLMAILSLSIGIGATTVAFTLLNRAVLRPLPVERPEQIVSLNQSGSAMFSAISFPNYADLRDRVGAFSDLIGYRITPVAVSTNGVNERLWAYLVTANYFTGLGVRPAAGRLLDPEDFSSRDAHAVTVISHGLWKRRFGGVAVGGQTVRVNGREYTVVGVTPEGFFGTEVAAAPDFYFPVTLQSLVENSGSWLDSRRADNLFVVGRLQDGVTAGRAQAELDAASARLAEEHPDIVAGRKFQISEAGLFGSSGRLPTLSFVALLFAIAVIVLLLTCVNLANLLLARSVDRRREMAIRLSIGSGRGAIVRQLLIESLILSLSAGAVGLFLASWTASAISSIKLPAEFPLAFDLPMDGRVFGFNLVISVATAILFGLMPALQASRGNLNAVIQDSVGGQGRRGRSWRSGLIAAQVMLSLILLTGAGLTWRALGLTRETGLGFSPDGVVEVSFDLRLQGYPASRNLDLQESLLDDVLSQPGIVGAAVADMLPVDLHFPRARVFPDTETAERGGAAPAAYISRVSSGYLATMGIPLVQGRNFTETDRGDSPRVVLVNEAFARRFWPAGQAVGQRVRWGSPEAPPAEIVGIVGNGKYSSFNERDAMAIYRCIAQGSAGTTTVVARTSGQSAEALTALTAAVQRLDPHMPLASARTLEQRMAVPLLPARIASASLAAFGVLALILSAIGLYGVMSCSVSARVREIGVRMAMGADRRDVFRMVLGEGGRPVLGGIVAGLVVSAGLFRLIRAYLFGLNPMDPLTYAAVVVLLGLVTVLACWMPVRHALRQDPLHSLRN